MYFTYFATYMMIGFTISLAVFLWALNRGQFRDQQRARFLALEARPPSPLPAKLSRRGRIETYSLFVLAACGLAASAAVIVFALSHRG